MTMQALNQLVARSIIDPTVVDAYSGGKIGDVLSLFDFSADMRSKLSGIQSNTWAEYAIQAYGIVKVAEEQVSRMTLPSPLEGLLPEKGSADKEQVA
jgi:hypothetical protein